MTDKEIMVETNRIIKESKIEIILWQVSRLANDVESAKRLLRKVADDMEAEVTVFGSSK